MVPSTWLAVVLFVVVVAPGLWFESLSERRRAGFSDSVFRETGRVVLSSMLFATVALTVLAIVRTAEPHWMPNPELLLKTRSGYAVSHYRLVTRALLLEVAVSFAAVWAAHCWFIGRAGGTSIQPVSAWKVTLRDDVPKRTVPVVWAVMEDGKEWMGRVQHYSSDLEVDGRELILGPPLWSGTGRGFVPVHETWQRVVLNGSAVKTLAVQYRDRPPDADAVSQRAGQFTAWWGRRWRWVRARP